MTLPEKEPFLTPAFSPPSSSGHPQATGIFRGVSRKWKTCCLVLRVNTAHSCVPTTHTGRTSPCGTDSPLCPLSQEGCRTVNSRTEPNKELSHTFFGITLPFLVRIMHTVAGGTSGDPTPFSLPLLQERLDKRAKKQRLLGTGIATETCPSCKSKNTEHLEWRPRTRFSWENLSAAEDFMQLRDGW